MRGAASHGVVTLAQSKERLLDEASLFLHRDVSRLPEAKLKMLLSLQESDAVLADKKILVVDDDVRNIFALSSVLERYRIKVVTASTGLDAIRLIEQTPDLSLVLLDIMMPEMDGYETMREIRRSPRFKTLPILALNHPRSACGSAGSGRPTRARRRALARACAPQAVPPAAGGTPCAAQSSGPLRAGCAALR